MMADGRDGPVIGTGKRYFAMDRHMTIDYRQLTEKSARLSPLYLALKKTLWKGHLSSHKCHSIEGDLHADSTRVSESHRVFVSREKKGVQTLVGGQQEKWRKS